MTILGIDPGTHRVGYGVIKTGRPRPILIAADLLPIVRTAQWGFLKEVKGRMAELLKRYQPDIVAVEELFFVKNLKTGLPVAHARGVILLSVLEAGARLVELSPNEIKSGLTGNGHADKRAVAKMVRLILKEPTLRVLDDVSDALAVALVAEQRLGERVKNRLTTDFG